MKKFKLTSSANGKVFRSGLYSTAILATAIVLAVLVNLLVGALPKKYPDEVKKLHTILGFKSPADILFRDDLKNWEQQMDLILTVDSSDVPFYRTGLVTKYIPELELDNIHETAAIVVGPPIMMKFAVAELLKMGMQEEQIWISQERKMCCGLGKCGHCRMNDTYICLDGPVFCYSEGKKLFD